MPHKPLGKAAIQIVARNDLKPLAKLIYLTLLNDRTLHVNELCERTSLPRSSVYYALSRLAKKRLVKVRVGMVTRIGK